MHMTKRQREMLDKISGFIGDKGYSPTLEEIGDMMHLSSPATVHKHLQNLEEKGVIRRSANRSRAIEVIEGPAAARATVLPMLGYVAAGMPIEAIENPDTFEVPREFVRARDTFVLKVKGDSMIEDGIHDGDWIIVEKREKAETGATVVALVHGSEATVKRFYPERDGKVRLQPANASMNAMIFPARDVQIQGVLVGLMRKYRG